MAFRFQWIEHLTPPLIQQWADLAACAQGPASFCHYPTWHARWSDCLRADGEKMLYAVAYQHDRLIGVWPLLLKTARVLGVPVRWLTSPDHDHVDRYDPPLASDIDAHALTHAWLHWLETQHAVDWDVLRLKNLPVQGALGGALTHAAPHRIDVRPQRVARYVDTSSDPDLALAEVSTSFRRNLRRLERRAQGMGELRYDTITDPAQLGAALERFLAVEADGWKGEQGQSSAIACSTALRRFYSALTEGFGMQGDCEIRLLRLGELDIAAQWCLRGRNGLSILKIGYRESHQAVAPGNLLMLNTLLDACARADLDRVSFLTDPAWSSLWKAAAEPIAVVTVYRHGHARARWAQGYAALRRLAVRARDQLRHARAT